jgi:PAS domain S-box-containing protein
MNPHRPNLKKSMDLRPIRVLLAEDSDDDAELILHELRRQGFCPDCKRVMDAVAFKESLENEVFDVILCDYVMPSFLATDALIILRDSSKDVPLIIVSGTIGEEVAVEAMRQGAADYLLKDRLTRLGAAVEREVREAELRRRKRLLDLFTESQSEVLEMILTGTPLANVLDRIIDRLEMISIGRVRCSIVLDGVGGAKRTHGSAPALPEKFLFQLGQVTPGRDTNVPLGYVVVNLETQPDWSNHRGLIETLQLRGCWAVPVFSSARKISGYLAVYHRDPHEPGAEELRWLESASKLVSIAIERSVDAEKLRQSETLLRIASQSAHIGGWSVELPARSITWSDEVCAIHGMSPGSSPLIEEAISFFAPEYRSKMARVFDQCLSGGIHFDEESVIVSAAACPVWVRIIGECVRDQAGGIKRIQGAVQDINDLKLAKEEVERSAARMTSTLESITDVFFIIDHDWRISYINKQAEVLVGIERSDLLGNIIWEMFPALVGTNFEAQFRRAMADDTSIEFCEYFPPIDRWFEVRGFPTAEGLAVTLHDVTDRLRSEEQLKLLENCVSRINDIVIITESELIDEPGPRIVFVNDAFERRTGYRREEVIGKSPRFLQGPDTHPEGLARIRTALKKLEPVRTELINYTKAGEKMWLDIEIIPVTDGSSVLKHLVAVARDITERKVAEEILQSNEIRYLKQRNALISLTAGVPQGSTSLVDAFRTITEASAKTLEVSRVSIWRYSADRTMIECLNLYDLESDCHTLGVILYATDYPAYFQSLVDLELIVADNARENPYTSEFSEGYLTPLGITSMIDAPIRFGSEVQYVMCHEHVGPARNWTADEKTFVIAVANLVSLALEANERVRAEKEVLKSHQRFQSVAAATNDTIWDWDLLTNSFWWNDGFAHLFGWTATETEPTIHTWIRQIHPSDRQRVVSGIYAAIEGDKTHWVDEYRFLSNDGSVAHVLDRGEIIRDSDGRGVRMVGGMTDLTEQKSAQLELARSHRALQMLSSCNELLIRASDENALLSEVCRLAVNIGGYRMAWVGYAIEDHDRRIAPMAHAGDDAGQLNGIDLSWSENHSSGLGLVGRTVREGTLVVCEDVASDPWLSEYLKKSCQKDVHGVVSLPLSNETKTFGALVLFATDLQPTGADELNLLKQMANDLAFGIQNLRVRMERQRTQEVVLKVAQAVSTGVGAEFFDLLTRNMVEALGADGGGIAQLDSATDVINSFSFYLDGHKMGDVTYNLAGTACKIVADGNLIIYPRGVGELFPEDRMLKIYQIESFAGIPLFDSNEQVCGIMVVFFREPLNETALVESTLKIFAARAAAELERQQFDARIREQASLLDKAQDAILVRDLNHIITYWNKSAERMYGWTAEEAIGRPVTELLYRDCTSFDLAFQHTLQTGEWVGELRHYDKQRRDLIIESRWTLVRDLNGNPQSLLVINTDISEHRKLEQQFERAQRLESIGTLAGGIAHDLNNILAPISMAIELLKMRLTDPRGTELLDTIAASAKRGTDMVSQVLSFARGMDGRRLDIHPMKVIGEVEAIMRNTFLRNIGMEVKASRELWMIQGDPTQLHQVLINLCLNARDAVSEGGMISVSAENVDIDESFAAMNLEAKIGPHVRIEVEDNGSGISPENIDKIFDPFFTTKSVGKGTGLGLSTSRAIIKSHGGFIRAFSKLGKGTRFRVYLPAIADSMDRVIKSSVELPKGNGETILIVDDEELIREITKETLETFGYQTHTAADGDEAIAVYARHQTLIDVVLTDMMMPGIDGAEMIQTLMKINPEVRVVATSGIAANKEIAYSAGTGVKGFLPKPCTAEILLKCLRDVLA